MQTDLNYIDLNPPTKHRGIFYSLVFWLVLLPAVLDAQARLSVIENKKSFGHVKKGEVVTASYEIGNTGDKPLLITKAEAGCDCTSARYPKEPLLPGGTATVIVTFDTKGAYGRQDRSVFLHSNDPKGPAKLRLRGTVDQK